MFKHIRSLLIAALLGFGVLAPATAVAQSHFHGDWSLSEDCGAGPPPSTGSILGILFEGITRAKWSFRPKGNLWVTSHEGESQSGQWSYRDYTLTLHTGQDEPVRFTVEGYYHRARPVHFVGVAEDGEKVTFWKCE